jgi:16S rRNA (cytosine1402-N4)-methyltransferase
VAADDERTYHIPVLCEETLDLLVTDRGGTYVDGTLGGGGHSAALLERLDAGARVIGVDQDPDAVAWARSRFREDGRMTVVHNNFIHLRSILHEHGIRHADGVLLDLGMSSRHVDAPERGFSFQHDGPLDMRMDQHGTTTAADLVREMTRDELAHVLFTYGEERLARRIAAALVEERAARPVDGTARLAEVVARCVPPPLRAKTLARVFQALRIAVNDELGALRAALAEALDLLAHEGRLVVISYHSLEDRIVKHYFTSQHHPCTCPPKFPRCMCGAVPRLRIITRHALRPHENEIRRNPRARSARLRACAALHA